MHTTASDGTDTPAEILSKVLKMGIQMFSVTDHDGIAGVTEIRKIRQEYPVSSEKLLFLNGIEFSCRDEEGKYHILGYGYDENAEVMLQTISQAHENRLKKTEKRIRFLKEDFGFTFQQKDIDTIFEKENPGRPHIANLMVRYGFVKSINEAMDQYLNKKVFPDVYIDPKTAIAAIRKSGGISVLAHPSFGDGNQLIRGEEMNRRLKRLTEYGLGGVEAYYPGFSSNLVQEMLDFAETYDLYVTAGSDYHGKTSLSGLGRRILNRYRQVRKKLRAFLKYVIESKKLLSLLRDL